MTLLTVDERRERGRAARKRTPRSSHSELPDPPGRADPVRLLEEQNATRLPWLVPIRHQRMSVSAFTFYRGSARIMAADLASTPRSGLDVQLGGDAHLSNFGAYASPERQLVFDANDFDETLRGPWEWDLKRLATSFHIAGLDNDLPESACREAARASVRAYREAMADFAAMGRLELWYDYATIDHIRSIRDLDSAELQKRLDRFERKAERKTSLQALDKLTVEVDGRRRIRSDPPVLFPLSELPAEYGPDVLQGATAAAFEDYKETLNDDRRWLLDGYHLVDMGVKVVGVGSVGTRCLILLLQGRDREDPLFLQAKEAGPSVLEEHLGPGRYAHHGQRVVEGQRMVQAQSDIFLGWTTGGAAVEFYMRQLRDWKGSAETDGATSNQLAFYARICGHTMARGHARSGDPVALSAYMGKGDNLDRAIGSFAEAYAERNAQDYAAFRAAIDDGRIPCAESPR